MVVVVCRQYGEIVRKSWRGGGNTGYIIGVLFLPGDAVDTVPFQNCVSVKLENGYGVLVVSSVQEWV
jgi:hypothetical protein